ncbi:MAG TPA: TonB-dependent receptor [Opitutaceae bacterium]|nr:TonB-dependent receptor [Opitutaceae bacterium]
MNMPTIRQSGRMLALACGAISPLFLTAVLHAQAAADTVPTTPATPETPSTTDPDVVVLDKFEVTGSYIPYASDLPANPVTVISAADIVASGASGDLLEVMRKTVPQFVGNGNIGSSNSNIAGGSTNGGRQVLLRNTATLVLINGRRAAFAPVAATGGFNFVDVNAIPVSAVERVEILTDGASATYGSDAVAGVVNVILKKDYKGAETSARYSYAKGVDGNTWEDRAVSFTAGLANSKTGTSVTISAEWQKSDPLFQKDRSFTQDQTGKTVNFPGVVSDDSDVGYLYLLKPGMDAPPAKSDKSIAELAAEGYYLGPDETGDLVASYFNLSPYVTLMMSNERKALVAEIRQKLASHHELFGDLMFARTKTFYQLAAQPIGLYSVYGDPEDPQNPSSEVLWPANRLVSHPRQYYSNTDSYRAVVGLKGDITDNLQYETAIDYNYVDQHYFNRNVLDREALADAIFGGKINMFARNQDAAATQANVFGVATSKNLSSLFTYDARVSGNVPYLTLPGGAVQFAAGFEFRRETLSATPDLGSYLVSDRSVVNPLTGASLFGKPARWEGATSQNPFSTSRKIASEFIEVRAPIVGKDQKIPGLYTLELNAAGRYENYVHSTEDPLVPKVSLRYLPFDDQFAIRASFGKSFTAPDLYNLYGPTGVGYTSSLTGFATYNPANPSQPIIKNLRQANSGTPSNPNLKPRNGKMYNLGSVWTPRAIKGLMVEAGYFWSKETDFITSIGSRNILQDVELNGANSEYVNLVSFNSFAGPHPTGPGQISGTNINRIYVMNQLINAGEATQDGMDLKVNYSRDFVGFGNLNASISGLWYRSYKVDGFETVGLTSESNGTIPRYQLYSRLDYSRNNYLAGLGVSYFPPVWEYYSGERQERVAGYPSLDLYVGYKFDDRWSKWLDGFEVRIGVDNVSNRKPPMSLVVNSDAGYDQGAYGSSATYGRVWTFFARKRF